MKRAVFLILLVIGGCGDKSQPNEKPGKADWCGYTWKKTQPVSAVVTIAHQPDWQKFPGNCRNMHIRGCASSYHLGGQRVTDILIREPIEEADKQAGACNTIAHELMHARGWEHEEAHSYTPQDYTR
jgi:hypothetical protein